MSDERKRKASAALDTAPAPKKTCADAVEDPANTEQALVVRFQKEAIWRQCQEYRRENDISNRRIRDLEAEVSKSKENLKTIWSCFEGLVSGLKAVQEGEASNTEELMALRKKRASMGRMLMSTVVKEPLEPHVLALCKDFKAIFGALISKGQVDIGEGHILAKYDRLSSQLAEANAAVEGMRAENESLLSRIEGYEESRKAAEKRRDRQASKTVSEVFMQVAGRWNKEIMNAAEGTPDSATPDAVQGGLPDKVETDRSLRHEGSKSNLAASPSSNSSPAVKKEEQPDPQIEMLISQELDEKRLALEAQKLSLNQRCVFYSHLASKRLAEQEEQTSTISELRREIDEYKLKLMNVPEQVVQDSSHAKTLRAQMVFYRNEMESWRGHCESLTKELEDVKAQRRKLADQIEMDDAAQKKYYEQEIKKLESECARLRTNRDHLQHQLDVRCSKDAVTLEQNQEIRVLANSRKDLIQSLQKALHRIRLKHAAEKGDTDAMKLLSEEWSESGQQEKEDEDMEAILRRKLRERDERIRVLESKVQLLYPKVNGPVEPDVGLGVSSEGPSGSPELPKLSDLVDRFAELERELREAKTQKARYENILNQVGVKEAASEADLKQGFQQALEKMEAEITTHQSQIAYLQAAEKSLTEEVDTLGRAWNQLEEQNKRKVLDLTEKEDRIVRLLMDKTKCEQKFALASKARDQANGVVAALKKESEKQLELIRNLEDREKNLAQQVLNMERQNGIYQSTLRSQRDRFNEISNQNIEFQNKLDNTNLRVRDMNSVLKDKADAMEAERQRQRRLHDEIDLHKKQIEQLAASKEPQDEELKKLVEEYKAALKCSACNERFKSHAIMRCLHVFCKQCLDSRLATRQRKCPTCYNMFLASDVKKIYL